MMFSTAMLIITNLALIGGSLGQTENLSSVDKVLQKASESVNVPGLNASAIPVEEAKMAFKKKCEANGALNAYSGAVNSTKNIEACLRDLVNVTVLQEEIENAKPTGDLDTVFKKYCNKAPELETCVQNFISSVELCFTPKERDTIRIAQNITNSLMNFVCFHDGDRIAMFIAAGGPACITSKQPAIQDCLNSTFGSYVPAGGLTSPSTNGLDNLPLLLLNAKECSDIEKLQTCVVEELEKCGDPTPGNIVDSIFNFIKKTTPCENLLKIRADASVGEESYQGSSTIIGPHYVIIALSFFSLIGIA